MTTRCLVIPSVLVLVFAVGLLSVGCREEPTPPPPPPPEYQQTQPRYQQRLPQNQQGESMQREQPQESEMRPYGSTDRTNTGTRDEQSPFSLED